MDSPFNNGFDPYDALIELNERMTRLEKAHNVLAHAYQKTEEEFSILLRSFQNLQKAHLSLSQLIGLTVDTSKIR